MPRITVTADDFGLCPEVNAAVCLLFDRGIIHRTSFLANTEWFDQSVQALLARPSLAVAIHLNATDGPSAAPPDRVPSLVDRNGRFRGGRHYGVVSRILTGASSLRELRTEWRAQIERAKAAGVIISQLNSHGHLHLLPSVRHIVADLLEEFAIPGVRLVVRGASIRGVVFGLCSLPLAREIHRRRMPVGFPDRILGLERPGALSEAAIRKAIAGVADDTAELIVHPSSGSNPFHLRWGYSGDRETSALLSVGAFRTS